MMGFYYGPAHSPRTSSWWAQPSGQAATTAWQQPNEAHWWNQPQLTIPWARPETSIQLWNEQPALWVQQGSASTYGPQQLTITAHASPQRNAQQQVYGQPAWAPLTQYKDTEQPSSEHAYRIAQLETAFKEQEQRYKEEATQRAANMRQHVLQQMEDWRTWKESDESPHTHKDKMVAELPSPRSLVREGRMTKQLESSRQPAPTQPSQRKGTPEHPDLEVKALFKRILTGMDVLLEGQAAAGTRKRRLPVPVDSPPPKRTAYSAKTYVFDEQHQKLTRPNSKQAEPMLPQKHKAHPSQPPWKQAASTSVSIKQRQPSAREQPAQVHSASGQEIVPITQNSPTEEEPPARRD